MRLEDTLDEDLRNVNGVLFPSGWVGVSSGLHLRDEITFHDTVTFHDLGGYLVVTEQENILAVRFRQDA